MKRSRLLSLSVAALSVAALAVAALAGCAASTAGDAMPPPPSIVPDLRLIVETVDDWPSAAAFAERAGRAAGVPVADVLPFGPWRFALTLRCADAAACEGARRRLAADTALVADVQTPARRTLPARPARSTAY